MKHNAHILKPNNTNEMIEEMRRVGADETGIKIMVPKSEIILIKVQNISLKAANILKQEMLAKGGDAVLHKEVSMLKIESSDVILMATKKQFNEIIKKLKIQPFDLKKIAEEIELVLSKMETKEELLQFRGKHLDLSKGTLIMGILNVTPDSFSDGGKYNTITRAVEHAKQMEKDGADIIDIGGESTRPGHHIVSVEEEMDRVIPIIEAVSKEVSLPISIDTYKAAVAKNALDAGAHIINDVWGFKRDSDIAIVAAEYNAPVILMHNRENQHYTSLMDDIISDLRESVDIALQAGVKSSNIILDPGIGFAKSYQENLIVMNRLDEITALGYPVLLGTSRKSIIGLTLGLPVSERAEGTAATLAMGIMKGCKIMRVHDVKEMKRVAKMMDVLLNPNNVGE